MNENDYGLIPESLRTEENKPLFESVETLEEFMSGSIAAIGQAKTLAQELEEAKKGSEGMIRVPGEDATEAEILAYRRALKVPENPSDYGFEATEDNIGSKELLEAMHKAGLTKAQAKQQIEAMTNIKNLIDKSQNEAKMASLNAFKESLGDKAELTFANAKLGVDAFFKDREGIADILLQQPELVEAMSKIGQLVKEKPGMLSIGGPGGSKGKVQYSSMAGLDD